MAEQSEVHKEVVRLRERISEFDGADVVRRIDPNEITASNWANRDVSHFDTDAFAKLKAEIANSEGNVQPIKVRAKKNPDGVGVPFEIVYGHRRHRACLELGIPVLALIESDMEDAELFVEMERENRDREDLSAWEQGVMYQRALDQNLFQSARQLAVAIERDVSNISRAMALAKLPADVIRAFGSPLNLQFRWATPLRDAHQRDPEGLLEKARKVSESTPRLTPAEVFSFLTRPPVVEAASAKRPVEWKDSDGKRLALLSTDKKGRAILSFAQAIEESEQRKLIKLIDGFLGSRS
ncbi:ParB/RepB/Spo0J family partition protein [Simplicispira suum]|nr:ParB/RepB/Spo0J family partition protein [Simplicispira suum]